LLPSISEDLHVSVTTAGLTVSLYALGVAFGAPVLTSLTANMSRKTLLISALSHGVFMSIGSTIAAALVPENKPPSAIALMLTGATLPTLTGAPIRTFIGQQFGRRTPFLA
ncbi:MFS transporter, partial [Bacillus paranthracis]|nr:MFS transporter [Bacillus paranthracis]